MQAQGLSLWDFVLSVYGRPGVQDACLALQDRFGADVNMVLFALWLAARDEAPSDLAPFLEAALAISRDWQATVVEPLRSCRRRLKDMIAADMAGVDVPPLTELRAQVKKSELEAERLQILALAVLVERRTGGAVSAPSRKVAANNLEIYFTALGITLDPLGQRHVARILDAACDG